MIRRQKPIPVPIVSHRYRSYHGRPPGEHQHDRHGAEQQRAIQLNQFEERNLVIGSPQARGPESE